LEFEERFASEELCRKYLLQLRWPNGFVCPRCQHRKAWTTNRELYRCSNCDFQVSLTANTIFDGTRKELRLWFRAIWYVTTQKHGVSALGLQQVLGLGSYRTAWTWLHKLRVAMVHPGRELLSGVVEVDETYIGGERSGKRGRGAAGKALVVIAVEDKGNRIGRIRMRKVPDASATSLIPFIETNIEPVGLVRTDGWTGYKGLVSSNYEHIVARQDGTIGDDLIPLVHRVAGLLKWLTGTHQGAVHSSHLDYYLDEFTFRFNRRTSGSRGKLFYRLLQQAIQVDPVRGHDILGN